jgi:hypothetical protein
MKKVRAEPASAGTHQANPGCPFGQPHLDPVTRK